MSDSLYRTVLSFRNGILGQRSPSAMCFAVCAPLQSYLSMLNIEASLIKGKVRYKDVGVNSEHYWLQLPDGRIIDPTADQFKKPSGESMPKVYIGELPEWYKAE